MKKTMVAGFEGGAIYTAEQDGRYLVIVDETTLHQLLQEEGLGSPIKTISFATSDERSQYLDKRYKLKAK